MKVPNRLILSAAAVAVSLSGMSNAEVILFAGSQGVVHQLDTVTGDVSFRGVCSGPVSSMVVHNGTLFLGDPNGMIYTFDVATDQMTGFIWIPADASAMSWLGDQLVVADSSGELLYIDAESHEVVETVPVIGTDITAIGIDAGGLFIGGHSTLAERTHIGQNDFQFFAACGSMINSMAFGADTMYLGGITFFGANAGTVYKFDKFAGGIEYSGTHGVDSDTTAMLTIGGMLYIGGSDGVIHEMNPESGEITRVFNTGIDIQAMTPEAGLSSCPADYDASGSLDFFDLARFINLYTNQLTPADTTGDGQFNFFDISEFVRIFNGGC